MESPLLRLLISFRSNNKHGHHRQFLFLKKQELPMTAMFVNVEFVRYCGGHFENGDR
jgi:hypothetical protein